MKNPLNKRLLRELREELGKYLVIFLLLTMTIGFVSGFSLIVEIRTFYVVPTSIDTLLNLNGSTT